MDSLIKYQTGVDNRLNKINNKIKSREASVKSTQWRMIEKKAEGLGNKEARRRINEMKREYNFFERRDLRKSLTTRQKIGLGVIMFNRTVVESNVKDGEQRLQNAVARKDYLHNRQIDATTKRADAIDQRQTVQDTDSQLESEIEQLENQPVTEDIQAEIDRKNQERLDLRVRIEKLNITIQSLDNEMHSLETQIGDLPDIQDLQFEQKRVTSLFADRRMNLLDEAEAAWTENFKRS